MLSDSRTLTPVKATDAKNRFGEIIERLQDGRESVAISHFGRVVGVFVPVEEYDRLVAGSPTPPPAELIQRFDSLVERMKQKGESRRAVLSGASDEDLAEALQAHIEAGGRGR